MIQKNGLEENPVCGAVLKILYAGEEETLDIDANGDLLIKAGGQELIHKVPKEQPKDKTEAGDAEMN